MKNRKAINNLELREKELFQSDEYAAHIDRIFASVQDDIENAELCEECGMPAQDFDDLQLIDSPETGEKKLLCSECYADEIEEAIYNRDLRATNRSLRGW